MLNIRNMFRLIKDSLQTMNEMFQKPLEEIDPNRSFNIETEINNFRDLVKAQNITDVDNHVYSYSVGSMYLDLISECEKLGDYVVNVVEARTDVKEKKQ